MKKSIKKKTEEIEKIGNEIKKTLQEKPSKEKQEKIFEAVVMTGAVAFVLYALLRMIFGKKKAKKKKSSWSSAFTSSAKKETDFGKMIKDQFFIILISIISEQLQKNLKGINIDNNGQSNLQKDSKEDS